MADILYLTHRMPFPPDKGDKIPTHHLLRHLASRHRVHLAAFVDAPADWAHEPKVAALCASYRLVGFDPRRRKLAAARALLTPSTSITAAYHASPALQRWVDETVARHDIRHALACCSAMAPFVAAPRFASLRRVGHFMDVDSSKWRGYADKHAGIMRRVYAREARTLLAMERAMTAAFDRVGFISDAEVELFGELAPESKDKLVKIPNGVDTAYFDPHAGHADPFEPGTKPVVFVGAMDYWPNVDAVEWFASQSLPRLREREPQAVFWIVGSNPSPAVRALAARPGVRVTGRVPDVRPYLAHAHAVVAPLRVARGTQNKVLEALSMACPVVMTPQAAGGIRPAPFVARDTHADATAIADAVAALLARPRERRDDARRYILEHYSWQATFRIVDDALGLPPGG